MDFSGRWERIEREAKIKAIRKFHREIRSYYEPPGEGHMRRENPYQRALELLRKGDKYINANRIETQVIGYYLLKSPEFHCFWEIETGARLYEKLGKGRMAISRMSTELQRQYRELFPYVGGNQCYYRSSGGPDTSGLKFIEDFIRRNKTSCPL